MPIDYEKFIDEFQTRIDDYFKEYSEQIYCHPGCCACCEVGEYPFSYLEIEYLLKGFANLDYPTKQLVKSNVENLRREKIKSQNPRFEYKCPFLINGKCCVYKYRGITCRTHGLAYLRQNGTVNVPYCSNSGLNFSSVFKDGIFSIEPIKENLNIDYVLKDFLDEMGEIKPLINWFLD